MFSTKPLWAVVCVLVFTQSLRAFSSGPPANRDGVSGVYCVACHRSFALNSGEGSVRILGLPAAWSPGETYTLQVIVSDPTAMRWGFQMSAVGASGDQAGQLIPAGDGRTFINPGTVNGKALQFVEHTSVGSAISSPNVFQFSYRTPDDPNFGAIRINVAGNAANGDGTNSGDHIYAIEISLPVLNIPAGDRQFVMTPRGVSSIGTLNASASLNAGFARMLTSSGMAGTGLAFLSSRQNNVLVCETGFAASTPTRSSRVYVEIGGGVNTGIALVNPNSQPAVVSFYFTDDSGGNFGQSSLTIAANSQVVGFLDQRPFSFVSPFTRPVGEARTFSFTSTVPITALTVRTRFNERGEFMMTSLPVVDLTGTAADAVSIPHAVDGGNWTTELLLVNNTDAAETGTFQFISMSGQSMSVNINAQNSNQFAYSIPARSSRRFKTAGSSGPTQIGWIEITPSANNTIPSAAAVLSARANNVSISETAIAASAKTTSSRVYAELSGNFANREARSLQTGVAISNSTAAAVTVNIEATNLDGTVAGSTTMSVPARGQAGLLLRDMPGLKLAAPFIGALWVSAPPGTITVSGLRARYNDRQTPELLVTAFPAFDEAATAPPESIFPQIVDSGGYATQFVLVGSRAGQSSGTLQFMSQSGQPLPLSLR